MAGSRRRADLDPDEFAKMLRKYVDRIQFITYGEKIGCPRQPKEITPHFKMYAEMGKTFGNGRLVFRRDELKAGFDKLIETDPIKSWFKQVEHAEDWSDTQSKRMFVQFRHIMQAITSTSIPNWVRPLWSDLQGEEQQDDEEDEDYDWKVDWMEEVRKTYRSDPKRPSKNKDYATRYKTDGDGDDPIIAVWDD
eukprot:6622003-Pyramimonas_sp.AAC.1